MGRWPEGVCIVLGCDARRTNSFKRDFPPPVGYGVALAWPLEASSGEATQVRVLGEGDREAPLGRLDPAVSWVDTSRG